MTTKSGLQSRQQRRTLFAQGGQIAANARKGVGESLAPPFCFPHPTTFSFPPLARKTLGLTPTRDEACTPFRYLLCLGIDNTLSYFRTSYII
jgi:hypothetical protein